MTFSKCGGVDFHDSVTNQVRGAAMSGPQSYNGTYDQVLFTQRAVELIDGHKTSRAADGDNGSAPAPLYLYVAYHNVHDACQSDRFAAGLQAPAETVDLYSTTKLDTWKVQAAMTTELDYGVGNITAALRRNDMWDDTLLIFMSDKYVKSSTPRQHTGLAHPFLPLALQPNSLFSFLLHVLPVMLHSLETVAARWTTHQIGLSEPARGQSLKVGTV